MYKEQTKPGKKSLSQIQQELKAFEVKKGEVWKHIRSGNLYIVKDVQFMVGEGYNVDTQDIIISYIPKGVATAAQVPFATFSTRFLNKFKKL